MSQTEFLRYLVSQLERADIPFMVSGSVASGYHGEPRATYDIDIVIAADTEQIKRLTIGLSERCYVSETAARDAVQQRTMFNAVDLRTGIKVDLIIRKQRPFSVTEFQRRQPAVLSGVTAFVASAEDCILSKLEWAKLGASDRQYNDALKIAQVSGVDGLDLAYLQRWAKELDIDDLVQRLMREASLC